MKYLNIPYLLALVFALLVASSAQASQLLTSISSIAAGFAYTCALTTAGGVKCWGYNNYGQLGDGTTTERLTPVDVVGLSSGVSAIAAGVDHTCAVMTAGAVKCWGHNNYGQLGDNQASGNQSNVPVDVVGLSIGVNAVAAGRYHTCAVTTAGGVKCWGYNYNGELGDGTTTDQYTPVAVVSLSSGVSAIAAGFDHTCALTTAGGVKCWGYNYNGQLGDGTTKKRNTLVAVVGLSSDVSAIAAGSEYTCAVTTTGGAKCWGGYNNYDQLGDGTTTERLTPVAVLGLSSGVSAMAAGYSHTCALTTAGGVQCWGDNEYGDLGDGTTTYRLTPVDVVGLGSGVSAIAAGYEHTCAVTMTGGVKCWGYNNYGQLGDGTTTQRLTPVDVLVFIPTDKPAKNDFDADHISDVLFLNSTTGSTQYWSAATKAQAVYPGAYDTSYTYAGAGDFNGDGKADLFFTRASNNGTLIWSGAVKSAASYPGTSAAGFNVAGICDVNGDGFDDIIWFNATTGGTQVWPSATKASATYPGAQNTAYTVVACGDFDGDGKADLFWRNNTTGADEIWLSGNKSTKLYPGAYPDTTWNVVGAGDVDGDGKSDVVWYQSTTGKTQVWHSGLKSTTTYPGSNATTFTPKAIGDYDGDGKADLLWGNDTTLGTQIWPGVVKANVTYPGTYTSGFIIQK